MEEIQSDNEEPSLNPDNTILQDAVRDHPDIAWEEVASRIGVKEDNFNNFYKRATELSLQPQLPIAKRTAKNSEGGDGEDVKRRKEETTQPAIPFSELINPWHNRSPSNSNPSSSSEQVRWAPSTIERAREGLRARILGNVEPATLSKADPNGSPTEVLSSAERSTPSKKSSIPSDSSKHTDSKGRAKRTGQK